MRDPAAVEHGGRVGEKLQGVRKDCILNCPPDLLHAGINENEGEKKDIMETNNILIVEG